MKIADTVWFDNEIGSPSRGLSKAVRIFLFLIEEAEKIKMWWEIYRRNDFYFPRKRLQ
jgi:hypothetical protein